MALDPRYIPLYNLQQYNVDKTTLGPLSNGTYEFYSDINRTIPKTVYELSSVSGSYTYIALPNPVNLSAAGTPEDDSGADIVIYVYPYDAEGNVELYYIVAKNALGAVQWTREAVPYLGIGGSPTPPSSDAGIFNYIPNGQFLSHTNPLNNILVAGSNYIAQGGWSVELSSPIHSNNTFEFQVQGFTQDPPQSPRYIGIFTANTFSGLDTYKAIRIKWNDVNKFSANNDFYTFSFWAESNVTIPVTIQIVRYFGTTGSVVPNQVIQTFNITTAGQLYQVQFQFPSNEGLIVDTVANNDFVAIDISLPLNLTFVFESTDFVLANGQHVFTGFPIQTNADTIARSVYGWTTVPDPTGLSLYLPPILTEQGMTWDTTQVGLIEGTAGPITSPLSNMPIPQGNQMPADGSIYQYHDRATNGIPFSRLGDYLISSNVVPGVPLYGTGVNFATAYLYMSEPTRFRLTVNTGGAVPVASDGNTTWEFLSVTPIQVAANTWTVWTYEPFPPSFTEEGFFVIQNVGTTSFVNPADGTPPSQTGFGFDISYYTDPYVGLVPFQGHAFWDASTVSAAALTKGAGQPAAYFILPDQASAAQPYYIVNGEMAPPVVYFQYPIYLQPSYSAADVAAITREFMMGFQITDIEVTSPAVAGTHWLFSTNPAAVTNYYVWYYVGGVGVDPMVPGAIGIKVTLTTVQASDLATVALFTQQAINTVQYAAPDFRGMFPRGVDFTAIYDIDAYNRWSTVSGLGGANYGTFEYQNFLQHLHPPEEISDSEHADNFIGTTSTAPVTNTIGGGATNVGYFATTGNSGGTETRPVNFYTNWFIRY
jgi:hypothetical protein